MHKNRAIFLDRDGVVNENRDDYVKNKNEFIFLPQVFTAINKFNQMGFLTIIITNQSAINRGIITKTQLDDIHTFMLNELEKNSCKITKIYFCPHRPDEDCSCRKPQTGLLTRAIEDFDIDISNSWLIGDKESDILAAKKIGLKSIFVNEENGLLYAVNLIKKKI